MILDVPLNPATNNWGDATVPKLKPNEPTQTEKYRVVDRCSAPKPDLIPGGFDFQV